MVIISENCEFFSLVLNFYKLHLGPYYLINCNLNYICALMSMSLLIGGFTCVFFYGLCNMYVYMLRLIL